MIGHSQSLDSDCVHLTPNCMLFAPRPPPQASRISILGLGLDKRPPTQHMPEQLGKQTQGTSLPLGTYLG